jgi:DNA-binding transcriptional regulator PaaX
VWISPDPVADMADTLKQFRDDAESFTILECRCTRGFADSALVKAAWPFAKINDAYRAYEKFTLDATQQLQKTRLHPRELFGLIRTDRAMWRAAFQLDPLLPLPLWPAEYQGRRAWEARKSLLRLAASQLGAKTQGS